MRPHFGIALSLGLASLLTPALLEASSLTLPKSVEAGSAFSIPTSGSGKATLFIIGQEQVLKRDVNLGETVSFDVGTLFNAGKYVTFLTVGSTTESDEFEVVPASVQNVSFLAKPSRLAVSLHGGITGAVYTFDAYHNLIVKPMQVSFDLTSPTGANESRSATTANGSAWIAFDSTGQKGNDKFTAHAGDASTSRIINQVPGDPCGLKMSAKQNGQNVELTTEPVRDCSGNAVPDGTIVTFTESFHGGQSTVDVPLKRGVAQAQMPIHNGATITVASGVVMGNQIGWGK